MTTTRQLLTGALRLINVVQANEEPSANDMDISLEALNALMDSKSNDLLNIHTVTPHWFQLTPNKFKYSLGPGGDWDVTRPMRLEQSKLILNAVVTTPNYVNAVFTYSPASGMAPLTVTFTPLVNTYMSYSWDFGDGSLSTEVNPTHTFLTGGDFIVTLNVVAADGTATSAQTLTIVPALTYTFLSHTEYGSIVYQPQYEAAMSASPDPIDNLNVNWDQVGPQPVDVTYPALNEVKYTPPLVQNSSLRRAIPLQDTAYIWEVVIGDRTPAVAYTGLALEASWGEPTQPYGVPTFPSIYGYIAYREDGVIRYQAANYGPFSTSTVESYTTGDIIGFGLWYGYPSGLLSIFKNGVLQTTFPIGGSQGCKAFSGVVPV